MSNTERTTEELAPTGHVIGATYSSKYWGGTYRVIGASGTNGVEVECVTPGAGAHQTPGERWAHRTHLQTGRRADTRVN